MWFLSGIRFLFGNDLSYLLIGIGTQLYGTIPLENGI